MVRKTKQDWLEEGLKILAESGANALKIATLTTRLGVTKGSFYHHFRSFHDFKVSLLTFFEEEGTLKIIELAEEAEVPKEKMSRLLEATASGPPQLEVALRAWALQDEVARTYQERIDRRRVAYVEALCLSLTSDEGQARAMGQLLYTIYVGSQHILPPLSKEALMQLYQEFKRVYGIS